MYLSILVGVYGLLASAALLSPRGQDALFTMLTWLIWFCEAGAMYGVLFALPLVCLCVASGATLCYLISALLGPALLLASEKWRDRLEQWRERIRQQGGNMISYLIVLRWVHEQAIRPPLQNSAARRIRSEMLKRVSLP